MRKRLTAVLGTIGFALALATTPATATDFDLTYSGITLPNGSTTYRDFQSVVNGQTLNVRASAWTISNAKIYSSYLGAYADGLGVTSGNESGLFNTHLIDNQYEKDFVLLQFSAPVLLSQFTTTPALLGGSIGSDATIGWGSISNAWNATIDLDGKASSTLDTILTQTSVTGTDSSSTRTVSGTASNLWLVAASLSNPDGKVDGFKLAGTKVSSVVPEPATWMMMILGFGLVGMTVRRRKAADLAVPQLSAG